MPRMNTQTKLVFALEHIAHLYDLIEDNEYQESLTASLSDLESVPKLISKPLKEKIKYEAQELNFLKRTSRAKLVF